MPNQIDEGLHFLTQLFLFKSASSVLAIETAIVRFSESFFL